ncbi:MAG: SIR2 family protein [Solirubrobacterales bacterium]
MRISVPQPKVRHELQRDRAQEQLLEKRVRCIAVVGAGASAPLLKRGDELATQLEDHFSSQEKERKAELFRLQRVYGLYAEDFETRLAALSRTPEITQHVRETISDWYAYRHPTILGYELLAHLLKHRFLDAIISFNFDELLDQSLDDELGKNGYRRIVSERDCLGVESNADSSEYVPIYIKLHGTATEPDSLRLTREAYYKLPQKLMQVVEELLESDLTVVVNVGSSMTGFDLHRLLRIPEQLEIYDLSPKSISDTVQVAIGSERKSPLPDSFHKDEKREAPTFDLPADELTSRAKATCDRWLKQLVHEIEARSGENMESRFLASLVRFRSVDRHEAVAEILGPEATLSRWTQDPKRWRQDYVDYLRQRTIIELAFSGAKARGLAQLSWLAVDRCGTYFELYRHEGRDFELQNWNTLRVAGGLDEHEWLPDVAESQPSLCKPSAGPTLNLDNGKWALREFVPKALAEHLSMHVGKDRRRTERRLSRALKNLQEGSEVEIDATDDQVCAKAFDHPLTLPTITSLRLFTIGLFKGLKPEDEVYISCETGEWLLRDKTMFDLLSKQDRVEVITAFDFKSEELDHEYGDRLTLLPIDPWRHNRHMTIVCRRDVPRRAIYFARRLRTPMITPVYLRDPDDAARVKRAYDLMRSQDSTSAPVTNV